MEKTMLRIGSHDFKKGKVSLKHGLRTKSPKIQILLDPGSTKPSTPPTFTYPDGDTTIMFLPQEEIDKCIVGRCWTIVFSKGGE